MKRKILITGVTSGFGHDVLNELISQSDMVYIFARDTQKAKGLLGSYENIQILPGNLSDLEEIKISCEELVTKNVRLDQIVLNAGTWNFSCQLSKNGIEEIFQVNLLSNLLIIDMLLNQLNSKGRIILTSSGLHQGEINFNDIELRSKFSGFKSYRQSKLGVILLTKKLSALLKDNDYKIVCQHPGLVKTKLARDAGLFSRLFFNVFGKSSSKGAKTLKHLINMPYEDLVSGEYYSNCRVTKTTDYSNDLQIATKLLDVLSKLLLKTLGYKVNHIEVTQ